MQVFGIPLSPFVRKVHCAAAEKGIAIEMVPANPRDPSPAFLAASPFRKIPALVDGDFQLADSTAIVTYFEAIVPQPALLPAEARQRARAIWFEEFADTVLVPSGAKIVFNRFVAPRIVGRPGNEEAALEGERELPRFLDWLEGEVPDAGWLAGEHFSVGDIAVASVLRTLAYVDWGPDAARYPRTAAWYDRVAARPAWQQVAALEAEVVARL
ncbi:MAG: glutathione S-transferase family protein [Sphingomonadales bacterium]|nr:glutathione S-transferase family protein [Sphingomonadales bacterium]